MRRGKSENHRLDPFPHSGILLVDKPAEWTSHDVVNFIRCRFNVRKVGHCGTLDPAATGLLVLLLGKATKSSNAYSGSDKCYEATMLLGVETDSQDMDGEIISEKDTSGISPEDVRKVCSGFRGDIQQIPPMVSAVKKNGKRLYELAREGKTVEREPKDVTIHSLEITRLDIPEVDLNVKCSKGTYVRTLCADIGAELGCGAVLKSLARTGSGEFSLEDAHDVEDIRSWTQDDLYRGLVDF